ncbi:MAG: hypothetical protein A2Z14_03265 [Chloroflexi bacterium RBG_16_48_8]|nr:MAG: hypothetical protein A2Z14_03265 [Chloroflexi bacterium RBG_16_48_8]
MFFKGFQLTNPVKFCYDVVSFLFPANKIVNLARMWGKCIPDRFFVIIVNIGFLANHGSFLISLIFQIVRIIHQVHKESVT